MKNNIEQLKGTQKLWQKHTKQILSLDDAGEIRNNLIGLISYLIELDNKYNSPKNED